MEALRGHTSGLAVPTFVIDAPGGGGKVPIAPQYLLSQSAEGVLLRNYEGRLATYPQPTAYGEHQPEGCLYCRAATVRAEQVRVAELLASPLPELKAVDNSEPYCDAPHAVPEEVLAR
jgi:lysine 2,3-aminomutase